MHEGRERWCVKFNHTIIERCARPSTNARRSASPDFKKYECNFVPLKDNLTILCLRTAHTPIVERRQS